MSIKKIKLTSIFILSVVLYCFFTYDLRPYFFWDTYNSGAFRIINMLPLRSMVGLMVIFSGLLCFRKKTTRNMAICALVIPLIVGTSLLINSKYMFSLNWLIPIATMIYVLSTSDVKEKSFVYFYNTFLALLIIPILVYILVHIGINVPYKLLDSQEDIKQATNVYYKIYPLACQWTDPWNEAYRALRLCGVYSEPGVVGTFCAMFLCSENFQLKNNWKNIIILIGGILSFSLAFYIVIFVYIFWRAVNTNWKYGFAIVLIIVLYFIFINISFDNPVISNFQSRLIINSSGLSGNNRTNTRYDVVFGSLGSNGLLDYIFGRGFGAIEDTLSANSVDGASYKNLIFNYGFVGFGLQIIWYFAISLLISSGKGKRARQFCLGMCLIMCANMYQRPTMFGFQYLVIMLGADYCFINGIKASKQKLFDIGKNRTVGGSACAGD